MNNEVDEHSQGYLYIVSPRGYSAYEIAVQNGFVGTEEEWLASLKGDQGDQGIQGKSAYQVSVENGYIGTEEDWVNDFLTPEGYYNQATVDSKLKVKPYYTDSVATLKTLNLEDGDCIITLGYYNIGDGGNAEYAIIDDSDLSGDNGSIIALNNGLFAKLISRNVNIKMLGAKGDDTNDDTVPLRIGLNKFSKLFIPKGTYKITENILVINKTTLVGEENSVLHFSAGTENLSPYTDSKLNMYDVKIVSDAGICYHVNRTGVVDTRIENNNIYSKSYSILVNTNTDDGQNLYITNNTIDTSSDGIEINTVHNTNNKFKNIVIENNMITVLRGSGGQSGFPIGIANGKNINITNNVIDGARNEAIHVEDYSEQINIVGNTLNNCQFHGIRINTISDTYKRCNISNNIIIGNKITSTTGIQLTTAPSGVSNYYNISSCYISDFDIGLKTYRETMIDNVTIANCNKAFNDDTAGFKGDIRLINTPIIVNYDKNGMTTFDSITVNFIDKDDFTDIDTFITNINSSAIITFNKLFYRVNLAITSAEQSRKIRLLKVPTSFVGTISLDIRTGSNNYGKAICNLDITNGTLTKTTITTNNNGSFTSTDNLTIEDGYLCVTPYNPNQDSGKMIVYVSLEGKLVIKGTY